MRIGVSGKKVFFTSDTHFGHKSIIEHCSRPYSDVKQMNAELITNWNSRVGVNDVVFHLGDVALRIRPAEFKDVLGLLNGVKYLIPGNHDRRYLGSLGEFFTIADHLQEVVIDGELVVLCHFPLESWNRGYHGVIHLHGHSHGRMRSMAGRMDVGVDAVGYKPIEWVEVKRVIKGDSDATI